MGARTRWTVTITPPVRLPLCRRTVEIRRREAMQGDPAGNGKPTGRGGYSPNVLPPTRMRSSAIVPSRPTRASTSALPRTCSASDRCVSGT